MRTLNIICYSLSLSIPTLCNVFLFSQILPALCVLIHHTDVSVSITGCAVLSSLVWRWQHLPKHGFKKRFLYFFSLPLLDLGGHRVGFVLPDWCWKWADPNGHRLRHCPSSGTSTESPRGQSSGGKKRLSLLLSYITYSFGKVSLLLNKDSALLWLFTPPLKNLTPTFQLLLKNTKHCVVKTAIL